MGRRLVRFLQITVTVAVMTLIRMSEQASLQLGFSAALGSLFVTPQEDSWKFEPMPLSIDSQRLRNAWKNLANDTKYQDIDDLPPLRHVVLPYVWNSTCPSEYGADAVTAITHTGVTKLDRLLIQSKLWDGPVSVSVYISSPQDIDDLVSFWNKQIDIDRNDTESSSVFCHISMHVAMELVEPLLLSNSNKTNPFQFGYPHNLMRNVGLDNCAADYFTALDVDFIPFPGAHDKLQSILGAKNDELRNKMKHDKSLLVMPAFDTLGELAVLPRNYSEAVTRIPDDYAKAGPKRIRSSDPKSIFPFHLSTAPRGHGPTDFERWMRLDDADPRDAWYETEYSYNFEPYVVGHLNRTQVPPLLESLRGFGLDKMSWFLHLNCRGFKFLVLRDMVVFHLFHEVATRENIKPFFFENQMHYGNLRKKLKKEYPTCNVDPRR